MMSSWPSLLRSAKEAEMVPDEAPPDLRDNKLVGWDERKHLTPAFDPDEARRMSGIPSASHEPMLMLSTPMEPGPLL